VCKWVVNQTLSAPSDPASRASCHLNVTVEAVHQPATVVKVPSDLNGKAVRGSSRQVYLVKNGVLHAIPDLATFNSIKGLDLEKVTVLSDGDMARYGHGEPLSRAT
jgi:sulfur transfer complex TusBCD TusB component (DsrH family)